MNVGRVRWNHGAWCDPWFADAIPSIYRGVGIVTHRVTFWGREFYGEIEHEG